jgi:hypothetical protein
MATAEMLPKHRTKPEVFILESLSFENEKESKLDGKLLADALRLYQKKPIYRYFRTELELRRFAQEFRESGYRYLHLSCHGAPNHLDLTIGQITNAGFAAIFEEKLDNRRLFASACELGNINFARAVFGKNRGCYSLIAPNTSPGFNRSAAFWPAFYFVMFDWDSQSMRRRKIDERLEQTSRLFDFSLSYFWQGNDGAIRSKDFSGDTAVRG